MWQRIQQSVQIYQNPYNKMTRKNQAFDFRQDLANQKDQYWENGEKTKLVRK